MTLTPFNKVRKAIGLSALFLSTLSFFNACQPEDSNIGLHVQPHGQPNLFVQDLADFHLHPRTIDSIRSSAESDKIIGAYADPDFGLSSAELFTEIRLSADGITIDSLDEIEISSAFLYLKISEVYGEATRFASFEIWESGDSLPKGDYFSNRTLTTIGENLAKQTAEGVEINIEKEHIIGQDTLTDFIAIPLDSLFGKRLLQLAHDAPDNAAFYETFRGIVIKENGSTFQSGEGSLIAVNPFNTSGGILVNYRTSNDSVDESLRFQITRESGLVNTFSHKHDESAIAMFVDDTLTDHPTVYVQSLSGLQTTLTFPDTLIQLFQGQVINKAELIFPVDETNMVTDNTPEPESLFLEIDQGDSTSTNLPDLFEGDSHFGGFYESGCNCYKFRITRYLQDVVQGQIQSRKLNLVSDAGAIRPRRVILKGKTNGSGTPALHVFATEYTEN